VSAIEFPQDRRNDDVIGTGARRIGENKAHACCGRSQID
jgi:hypothetical protein